MRVFRFFFYFSRTRGSFLYVSSRHCQNRTQPLRTVTAKTDPDDCSFCLFCFCFVPPFFFSKKRDAANLYHIEIFFFDFTCTRFHIFFFFCFESHLPIVHSFGGCAGKSSNPASNTVCFSPFGFFRFLFLFFIFLF